MAALNNADRVAIAGCLMAGLCLGVSGLLLNARIDRLERNLARSQWLLDEGQGLTCDDCLYPESRDDCGCQAYRYTVPYPGAPVHPMHLDPED